MKKQLYALLISIGLCLMLTIPTLAQTPRPTPTNIAQPADLRGSIFGSVYVDVNGDGNCIGTGVAGEGPAEGVNLQFTSSDGETVLTLKSGEDGSYGLVAAGESYWEVMAMPGAGMSVSSTNPQFVPVYADDVLDHTGVNFCVRQGGTANAVIVQPGATSGSGAGNSTVVLAPEAGAAQNTAVTTTALTWLMLLGVGLVVVGTMLEMRRRGKRHRATQ